MLGQLLLYLMVTDLREASDDDLRTFLEVLLRSCSQQTSVGGQELQEEVLDQLAIDSPDRDAIAGWPDDFAELLPPAMGRYPEALDLFEGLLEELPEAGTGDTDRLARFRSCLDLVALSQGWEERSEAARGLATLEEELFALRDQYVVRPMTMRECSPASVVGHRYLLEALDTWQEAFRLTHRGKLEEAWSCAGEADHILRGLVTWAERLETGSLEK